MGPMFCYAGWNPHAVDSLNSGAVLAWHALTSTICCTILLATAFEALTQYEGAIVPEPSSRPVSALLTQWRAGDQEALQALKP